MHVPRGLEGVIVASTELTKIDGQAGRLVYRGYDVTELAGIVPYEAVAHLLWFGQLPTKQQLAKLGNQLAINRQLPPVVAEFLEQAAKVAEPLSLLQTSVSILGGLESTRAASIADASLALTARMPTIVASGHRLGRNQGSLEPLPELGHVAN